MSSFDENFEPYRASYVHDERDARFGWELRNTEVHNINRAREILRAAICQTLDANGHLADGDVCTLMPLKLALRKVGYPWSGDIPEDLSKCPQCGGDADNGHDRCLPPSAYLCSKCSELLNAEILGVEAVPCNDGLDIVREE